MTVLLNHFWSLTLYMSSSLLRRIKSNSIKLCLGGFVSCARAAAGSVCKPRARWAHAQVERNDRARRLSLLDTKCIINIVSTENRCRFDFAAFIRDPVLHFNKLWSLNDSAVTTLLIQHNAVFRKRPFWTRLDVSRLACTSFILFYFVGVINNA